MISLDIRKIKYRLSQKNISNEKITEIVIKLLENKKNASLGNHSDKRAIYFDLVIAYVIFHYNGDIKNNGLKWFKKIIEENIFLFNEMEILDIQLTLHYLRGQLKDKYSTRLFEQLDLFLEKRKGNFSSEYYFQSSITK